MADLPKIVQQRLQATELGAQMPEPAHPEADVLNAFAEQSLSAAERETVMHHLALCADCRNVVALALPALDLIARPIEPETHPTTSLPKKERANWFAWANLNWARLTWAALAVGAAVAILVMRPTLDHSTKPLQTVVSNSAKSAPATETPVAPQAASGSMLAKNEARLAAPRIPSQQTAQTPSPSSQFPMVLAGRNSTQLRSPGAAGSVPSGTTPGPQAGIATDSAQLKPSASPASAAAPADSDLIAQADSLPITKAKPPLDEAVTSLVVAEKPAPTTPQKAAPAAARAQAALASPKGMFVSNNEGSIPASGKAMQNATWMIAAGVLQRSLDAGQSWQTVVRAGHPLLCYAPRGQEIWAGGQAGTLLHSTDAGATWSTVGVSFKGQSLSADITQIEVRDPAEIVLTTSNHQTWNSIDGGKAWEKK